MIICNRPKNKMETGRRIETAMRLTEWFFVMPGDAVLLGASPATEVADLFCWLLLWSVSCGCDGGDSE